MVNYKIKKVDHLLNFILDQWVPLCCTVGVYKVFFLTDVLNLNYKWYKILVYKNDSEERQSVSLIILLSILYDIIVIKVIYFTIRHYCISNTVG